MSRLQFPAPGSDGYQRAAAAGRATRNEELAGGPPDEFGDSAPEPFQEAEPPPTLSPDIATLQERDDALGKAMRIMESGCPFVIVGIKPVTGGCDFFTSVVGDPSVVGPAAPHLSGAVDRCLRRAGYTV